jgi:hypothetical protein
MHTKDILADELRKAGLPLMAKRAAEGVYSNGLSLHALPEVVLRRDLLDAHSPLADALLWPVDPANSTPLTTRSIKGMRA